ncbi:MAG: DUF3305 domain-containing protein [Gammaproteobacteria bacterium]|nr:DUF3305 domain-containing protein [Gammaproteobacteria bacterium]
MTGSAPIEITEINLPKSLAVSVIMESRPSASRWIDEAWSVVGVTVGESTINAESQAAQTLIEQDGVRQLLYSGFNLTLYEDECESYYHNIKAPSPGCYVIARNNGDDVPIPYLVSLSFDEANAYLECEDTVFTTTLAPELYRWLEEFVLVHYVPEKRIKRKRKNWKKAGREQVSG